MKKSFAKLLCVLVLVSFSFCLLACSKTEYVDNESMTLLLNVYGDAEPQEFDGIYTGEVIEGAPDGKGLFESTSENGVYWLYQGEWSRGHMNGEGAFLWGSGDEYTEEGTYQNDLFISGTITTSDYIYEGPVGEHGYYSGSGKLSFISGDQAGSYYEGTFANGSYNGQGVYHYADGRYYDGSFVDDEFCGEGTFYNADGSYFKGTWKEDKLNGQGAYYDKNGTQLESGTYVNGVLQKNTVGATASPVASASSSSTNAESSEGVKESNSKLEKL